MRGQGILLTDEFSMLVQPVRDSTGKIITGAVLGNTLNQNTGLIIISRPGEFKEVPALGVAIEDVLLDNDYLQWRRRIRVNLELDGQNINEIKFNSADKLTIDANY